MISTTARSRLTRRSLVPAAFAVLTVGSLLLAGCSAGESADQPASGDTTEATLMLNWTPNAHHAGIYYAQQQGWYEEEGIDLTIVEPGADVGVETAAAEGTVQFGIAQAESLLPARQAGVDAVAIATILAENDSSLMGLSGSGLTSDPSSLEGKQYGGYGGALETEIISELVTCGGEDPDSVDFVDIGNVDYLAGLEQERFDVTWVFEGWDALRAKTERDDVVTIPFSEHFDCIPNWYTPIFITGAGLAESDPELVRGFVEATARGYDAVAEDPALGSAALLEAAPELDEQLVTDAVEYYAPRYAQQGAFGEMEGEVWTTFADFLVNAKLLDDAEAVEGSWTNEFLPEQ